MYKQKARALRVKACFLLSIRQKASPYPEELTFDLKELNTFKQLYIYLI